MSQACAAGGDTVSARIAGVLPVLLMSYSPSGAVDEEGLHRQVDHIFEAGCQGFVVGQVSEVLRLTSAERRRVAELCGTATRGRGVSVMSTGAESAEAAIELSRHAQSVGVDALLVMHPATLALDDDEMVAYFAEVIRAVDLPVIVHHAKSFARQPLSIASQVRLLEEFGPDRVLFKPEASPTPVRVSRLRDATGGRARIFEGDGGMMLLDCHRRGLAGAIPATEVAGIVAMLWRLLESGRRAEAEPIGHRLAYLMCHMMTSVDGYASIAKHLLRRRGIIRCADVRGPVRFELDGETRQEVERTYDALLHDIEEIRG